MDISKDWSELLSVLDKKQVRYVVVGGVAYNQYAKPRTTKDLDIFISRTPSNSKKVHAAIVEFFGTSLGLKAEDFQKRGQIIQFGFPPQRVDFITGISGVSFFRAYDNSKAVRLGQNTSRVLSIEDLKRNKECVGRAKDLQDAKELSRIIHKSKSNKLER